MLQKIAKECLLHPNNAQKMSLRYFQNSNKSLKYQQMFESFI